MRYSDISISYIYIFCTTVKNNFVQKLSKEFQLINILIFYNFRDFYEFF